VGAQSREERTRDFIVDGVGGAMNFPWDRELGDLESGEAMWRRGRAGNSLSNTHLSRDRHLIRGCLFWRHNADIEEQEF
jgi:hypothetical protein